MENLNRRLGILAAALAVLTATGCSTPAVPEYEREAYYNAASTSYQNCVYRRYPTDQGAACDQVMLTNGLSSYNAYTYGSSTPYTGPYGKTGSSESVTTRAAYAKAYKAYLSTIEVSKLAEMTAEWDRLAQDEL